MDDILSPVAFRFLAIATYFLCFLINFLSALKHMEKLGLIPPFIARFIEKFIDIHKNKLSAKMEVIADPEEAPSKSTDANE